MNPARKPLALLARPILPGDRVGWGKTPDGFFRKTGDLIRYTSLGAYVWVGSGTAFIDADKLEPVEQ